MFSSLRSKYHSWTDVMHQLHSCHLDCTVAMSSGLGCESSYETKYWEGKFSPLEFSRQSPDHHTTLIPLPY